jgi:hypothetical protein
VRLLPGALREVATLDADTLTRLPEPTSLVLRTPHGRTLHATTSADVYAQLRQRGECVLSGSELGALAIAAEQDRASPGPWLDEWLAQRAPAERLTVATTLGSLVDMGPTPRPRWALGRVLAAWGIELRRVGVGSPVEWCNAEDDA